MYTDKSEKQNDSLAPSPWIEARPSLRQHKQKSGAFSATTLNVFIRVHPCASVVPPSFLSCTALTHGAFATWILPRAVTRKDALCYAWLLEALDGTSDPQLMIPWGIPWLKLII